jgi:hypothetical protein
MSDRSLKSDMAMSNNIPRASPFCKCERGALRDAGGYCSAPFQGNDRQDTARAILVVAVKQHRRCGAAAARGKAPGKRALDVVKPQRGALSLPVITQGQLGVVRRLPQVRVLKRRCHPIDFRFSYAEASRLIAPRSDRLAYFVDDAAIEIDVHVSGPIAHGFVARLRRGR